MRRRDYVFVIGVLAAAWLCWLNRLGVNDYDDMLSNELLFARQGLSRILFHNPWPDQSPLFFVFLHGIAWLHASPFTIQFVNAILLTITLAGTYALALSFSHSRLAAAAALVFGAVSPLGLWFVRNGRMYSLQVLFTVFTCIFVFRYLDRGRVRDLAAMAVFSLLNVYLHFVGFFIAGLLFVPVLLDAARNRERRAPVSVAVLAIAALAVPQIVRVAHLAAAPSVFRADVSLPSATGAFLDRVSRFVFLNSDWGALGRIDRLVTGVFLACGAVLAVAGLLAAERRRALTIALCLVVPPLAFALVAGRVDVRDRYFVWAVPFAWVAMGTGAFAALPDRWLKATAADVARGFRAALAVAVAAGSVWLLAHKLPEQYSQWTKLMTELGQVYRPSMVVYMPPASTMGSPRAAAMEMGLPAPLQDVRTLDGSTHAAFLDETQRGQDFIFLQYGAYSNDEWSWRSRYLGEHGYTRAVFPVAGARAEVFTRQPLGPFWREQRIASNPSADAIVEWARRSLAARRSGDTRDLRNALVARIQPDGIVHEGTLFASQRGENGSWKLGPLEWDAVEDAATSSGGVERRMIAAHPADGSILVVAFPATKMKSSLRTTYGIADSGLVYRAGANVDMSVYVAGQRVLDVSCPNTGGWKEMYADTSAVSGQMADVVILITTPVDISRHFAFWVEPSAAEATRVAAHGAIAGPVVLTGGQTLKDAIDQLTVYRIDGDRRIEARREPYTYSAADMHEAIAPGTEGSVRRAWALGALLWDAVGVTRQRSGGEARDGLWAHPRNGTQLVIEAHAVSAGSVLEGYFGLTDWGVARAHDVRVTEPVRFEMSLDGRTAFAADAPRESGWHRFAVPVPGAAATHDLRITISCARDSWAHFVFDVWSR